MSEVFNRTQQASLVKKMHQELRLKDIKAVFDAEEEMLEYAVSQGQKIKFGKLFIISPISVPATKRWDGINKCWVIAQPHTRFKFAKLKKMTDIENSTKQKPTKL